ncbi:MAG: nuclear transport factor 2 family protein [Proteobacteria bacterium]|nr:nuclear transport factor 2 family protein [Pseudomonadota bacterium]
MIKSGPRQVLLATLLSAVVCSPAVASGAAKAHTASAVLAVDQAWTDAEIRGDFRFVDALLLPEYRSIGTDGTITPKAVIVAGTRARGPHSDFGKMVAAYRAAHPSRGEVILNGDTAIVQWISLVDGKGKPVASCDVFVFRNGRWHALYSQHTTAEA